jgi:hypothetical protein
MGDSGPAVLRLVIAGIVVWAVTLLTTVTLYNVFRPSSEALEAKVPTPPGVTLQVGGGNEPALVARLH